MAFDRDLEEKEERYRQAQDQSVRDDAAALILEGYTREEAMAKALDINEHQQAADNDPTGVLGTLAEAQSPAAPTGNPAQIRAIASALRKKSS